MPADLKPTDTIHLFRLDIGLSEHRGYGAVLVDVRNSRTKGIRGNSAEQLMSRIRNVLIEELNKMKDFPLESEQGGRSPIITPEDGDPFFNGV